MFYNNNNNDATVVVPDMVEQPSDGLWRLKRRERVEGSGWKVNRI